MAITTCIFDAYGTLFDVSAAARQAAEEPGNEALRTLWPQLAGDWRRKQLEYTWLRAITGAHADFWQVTQDGLDWAMEAASLQDAPDLRERLLALYWELEAYPEVPGVLGALQGAGLRSAILSNGSPGMLQGAMRSAGLEALLETALSVESCGIFKPARAVYDLVGGHFGCAPEEVLFVSSNGWDAAGAAGYGFRSVWVNRAAEPVDRLPWRPADIVTDLAAIPALAGA